MSELNIYESDFPSPWKFYRAYTPKPPDVMLRSDGRYLRAHDNVLSVVCEVCWANMPQYRDFPRGLVSPESDDPAGNFSKHRKTAPPIPIASNPDAMAIEAVQKTVCVPCYIQAFERRHPGVKPPKLSESLLNENESVERPSESYEAVLEPRA